MTKGVVGEWELVSVESPVARNFSGSTAGLLINLLEPSPIKKKELDALDAYIQEYRKKQNGS